MQVLSLIFIFKINQDLVNYFIVNLQKDVHSLPASLLTLEF